MLSEFGAGRRQGWLLLLRGEEGEVELGLDGRERSLGLVLLLWEDGRRWEVVLMGRGPKVEEEAVRWRSATRRSLLFKSRWREGREADGSGWEDLVIDLDPKEAEERDRWMSWTYALNEGVRLVELGSSSYESSLVA